MSSATTEQTVGELRLIFAQPGLPDEVLSDNGRQFTSNEFAEFNLVPPYHPQSNGAAERSVRVVKEALVKQVLESNRARSMEHRLGDFLLRYRPTPQSNTGATPVELLMKRRLLTRLSLVKTILDTELVSYDVWQSTNEETEPSPCKESSPVILRRSWKNRKQVDRLSLLRWIGTKLLLFNASQVFLSILIHFDNFPYNFKR